MSHSSLLRSRLTLAAVLTAALVGTTAGTTAATAAGSPSATPSERSATAFTAASEEERTFRDFKRLTHRDNGPCWHSSERVRLLPNGGNTYVHLKFKTKSGQWVTYMRQTTLANGRFDLNAPPAERKQYKTKMMNQDKKYGMPLHSRVVVAGTPEFYPTISPTCITSAA